MLSQFKFRSFLSTSWPLLTYIILYLLWFSPVLFSNKFLAPGDASVFSLPIYNSNIGIWDQLSFNGYPALGDPQYVTWYPIKLIFQLFNIPFNIYLVVGYILASIFSYLLIKRLTGSQISGFVGGIVYGFSGFMMAHLGHPNIIHTVCWFPAIIWGISLLKEKFCVSGFLILILSIVNCLFAGHPQLFLYCMGAASIYGLYCFFTMEKNLVKKNIFMSDRFRFFLTIGISFILAIGITAIQIIPMLELQKYTPREELTYSQFTQYSPSKGYVPLILFPYVYGFPWMYEGFSHPVYDYTYFGIDNLTEITIFVGITTLFFVLIIIRDIVNKKVKQKQSILKNQMFFWFVLAILYLLLIFGIDTKLSTIMYEVPFYNLFRAHGRNGIVLVLSASILVGFGVKILLDSYSLKSLFKIILVYITIFLLMYAGLVIFASPLLRQAQGNVANFSFFFWENPTLYIPFGVLVLSIVILCLATSLKKNKVLFGILLSSLFLLDLGSFGWLYEWQYVSPTKEQYMISSAIDKYRDDVNKNNFRIYIVNGLYNGDLQPNRTIEKNIPSIVGYNPLILKEYKHLTSINEAGYTEDIDTLLSDNNYLLDILSVKYVFIPEVMVKDRYISQSRFKYIDTIGKNLVYENLFVLPTIRFSEAPQNLKNDEIFKILRNKDDTELKRFRTTPLVQEDVPLGSIGNKNNDTIKIIKSEEHKIQLETHNETDRFLVIGNTYYPGWSASIDGKPITLYKTNIIQYGLVVPKGTHTIVFEFMPKSLQQGIYISIGSFAIILIIITIYSYRRMKIKKDSVLIS